MPRRAPDPEERLEMTPMIDVTFLLLIFFIVTLNFRTLEGRLDATLPKDHGPGAGAEVVEKLDIVLRVQQPGSLDPDPAAPHLRRYTGRRIGYQAGARTYESLGQLAACLESLSADLPVTRVARERVVFVDVVPVRFLAVAACRAS
ncbi:MAG: biopolymer transporter ExbD, partial [Planctomycetes bacterium]|nr:biopolymer transporter ExbD [Planctomycetota bacterium]